MSKALPVVSLIGRPNVGKSSIYNRLTRKSFRSMTHDMPGVTRDRHYSILTVESADTTEQSDVILVDTGGFYPEKVEEPNKKNAVEPFFNIMADHAKLAIKESDLILFVVDVREGLLPFDETIAKYLREVQKPVWILVNKYDSDKQMGDETEFYKLGLDGDYITISAEHGLGLNTLRENIFGFAKKFNEAKEELLHIQKGVAPTHDVVANIAIIGAPNAGKSTLLNELLGAQRALVSNIAGTTVDPIEGYIDLNFGHDVTKLEAMEDQFRKSNQDIFEEYEAFLEENDQSELIEFDQDEMEIQSSKVEFTDEEVDEHLDTEPQTDINTYRSVKIVDTAGIRKQKLVKGFVEEQSVFRSLKAISESDVVVFMVDSTKGITHQDRRLCDIALEKGKSIVLCLNKIDLVSHLINDPKKKKEWMLDLRSQIPWLNFCEIITISALKAKNISSLKRALKETILIRNTKIGTGKLNRTVSMLVDKNPIVLENSRGTYFRVKYASMLKSAPPTFLFFTNKSKGIPVNFKRYLKNGLRREFNLFNSPVHLIFRTTTDVERRVKKVK